jgi:hypothetical protein
MRQIAFYLIIFEMKRTKKQYLFFHSFCELFFIMVCNGNTKCDSFHLAKSFVSVLHISIYIHTYHKQYQVSKTFKKEKNFKQCRTI